MKAAGQVFTIDDLRHGRSNMTAAIGIDPAFHRLYNERYESLNLHLQRARPLLAPGRVLASHQLCTDRETLATEYYQDFLRLQEGWFHLLGGCVAKDQSMLSVLSFMRGRRAGQFTDREIKVLESLMPHLRRAVRLHHVFAQNENLTALLDNQPVAAVFVGEQGSVHFANRSALAMLGRDDGIGIDRNGCLTSTDNVLRQMIAAACRTAAGNGLAAGGAVLVARASGKSPYTVSVSPFRNANPLSTVRYPGAVVFIVDAEIRREPIIQILQRLYGLTPAEASLAESTRGGKRSYRRVRGTGHSPDYGPKPPATPQCQTRRTAASRTCFDSSANCRDAGCRRRKPVTSRGHAIFSFDLIHLDEDILPAPDQTECPSVGA